MGLMAIRRCLTNLHPLGITCIAFELVASAVVGRVATFSILGMFNAVENGLIRRRSAWQLTYARESRRVDRVKEKRRREHETTVLGAAMSRPWH